jgi:hypothetical protein
MARLTIEGSTFFFVGTTTPFWVWEDGVTLFEDTIAELTVAPQCRLQALQKLKVRNNRRCSLLCRAMIVKNAQSLAQDLIGIGDFGVHFLQWFVNLNIFWRSDDAQVVSQRFQDAARLS